MEDVGRERLAPWQSRDGQMVVTDRELLERLRGTAVASPTVLAEGRRRENVIRLQCRYLAALGFVRSVGHDAYRLTDAGASYLDGRVSIPSEDGYLAIGELLDLPDRRLVDFTGLEADVVKRVNEDFFEDGETDYALVEGEPGTTRRRIWNTKGWKLDRLLEEFPRTEPLAAQCAHWMRAMAGLHFFPDANHRTGMATLSWLISVNDAAPAADDDWPGRDIHRAVLRSKFLRGLHADVRFDTLWLRDELFVHWHEYFSELFFDVDNRNSRTPTTAHLEDVLDHARNRRREP